VQPPRRDNSDRQTEREGSNRQIPAVGDKVSATRVSSSANCREDRDEAKNCASGRVRAKRKRLEDAKAGAYAATQSLFFARALLGQGLTEARRE